MSAVSQDLEVFQFLLDRTNKAQLTTRSGTADW